ncbi:hypothetical protein BH11PLA2_BH11PLA2_45060 [soil metagenome]
MDAVEAAAMTAWQAVCLCPEIIKTVWMPICPVAKLLSGKRITNQPGGRCTSERFTSTREILRNEDVSRTLKRSEVKNKAASEI